MDLADVGVGVFHKIAPGNIGGEGAFFGEEIPVRLPGILQSVRFCVT
jgi:hypothetical protein